MLVVDASAVVDFLLDPDRLRERFRAGGDDLHAPAHIDVEVLSALRRLAQRGTLTEGRARGAVDDLADLPLTRYEITPLLRRSWELREQVSAYDAPYVALAEALGATLVTRDARLARTSGHAARIDAV
ncbi:type II toxin-antitoxin system VapC family toxin [Cellulomonas sp. zg-ZUI188]|uniref:Ribonuclease VapC n=1 Tax=Cellulomonas fengjieae TaxID=2819978 RepID=A0ABS3SC19_9CELL|nr:type II toxin-antitoxin system VapC family toxin [Cellulomonas fengjieae]QVI65575.1 type II toxin-antitoxin system VapC family toxin [Cellulomonas fengjieae]